MDTEDRGRFRVLLTDDSKTSHILMKSILSRFECLFDSAMNGSEAVEKIKAGSRYSLIFMDSHMPVMDGITAVCEIRRHEDQSGITSTPIIMMSADDAPSDIEEFLAAGASDYLQKPISKESVLSILNKFFSIEDQRPVIEETLSDAAFTEAVKNRESSCNETENIAYIEKELEELIPIYIEHRRNDMNVLKTALAEQDFEKLKQSGHSLKGSGGGYGMHRLTDLGADLEESAKKQDINVAADVIDKIEEYLSNVVIKIK